jgi:hypothetical protein
VFAAALAVPALRDAGSLGDAGLDSAIAALAGRVEVLVNGAATFNANGRLLKHVRNDVCGSPSSCHLGVEATN